MVDLFEHQRYAVEHLRNGMVLCGGVGSGKSRAALAYFFEKVCGGYWQDDGMPIMTTPRDLYIITTAQKRDKLEWEEECLPFNLTTHSECDILGVGLKVDSWNNIRKYCNVCGAFFIFDEQRLVGSGAWVKAFYQIAKKNQWILLSATPGDTWKDYIPLFIANGFYKNRTEFCREHVVYSPYSKYPKIERYVGVRKLIRLHDYILVNMEFQRKTEMHHEYISVDYDQELYKFAARKRWDPFKNEPITQASGCCSVLRHICNSSPDRMFKAREVICENPRLIVFYNFDYELGILRDICKAVGVTFAEWNGHKHMPIPNTASWVYLVQYTAGAEGWNCTETNAILFYSPSYSYKAMVQAAGRIDRLDTKFVDLYCYHLISSSPIEKAINRCLKEKKDFNERRFFESH